MSDFETELDDILKTGSREDLEAFCEKNDLVIEDGKLKAKDQKKAAENYTYWDKRQLITKISLNALYGQCSTLGAVFSTIVWGNRPH